MCKPTSKIGHTRGANGALLLVITKPTDIYKSRNMQNPVLNNAFCSLCLNNIGYTFLMQFKCVFISMPLFVHGIVFAANIICVRNGTPGYS